MKILHKLFGRHQWLQTQNDTIGPPNVDPENPSDMKYTLLRECTICGEREIYRDVQWTKKTKSTGGEVIEKTPPGWLRMAGPKEAIASKGRRYYVGANLSNMGLYK